MHVQCHAVKLRLLIQPRISFATAKSCQCKPTKPLSSELQGYWTAHTPLEFWLTHTILEWRRLESRIVHVSLKGLAQPCQNWVEIADTMLQWRQIGSATTLSLYTPLELWLHPYNPWVETAWESDSTCVSERSGSTMSWLSGDSWHNARVETDRFSNHTLSLYTPSELWLHPYNPWVDMAWESDNTCVSEMSGSTMSWLNGDSWHNAWVETDRFSNHTLSLYTPLELWLHPYNPWVDMAWEWDSSPGPSPSTSLSAATLAKKQPLFTGQGL